MTTIHDVLEKLSVSDQQKFIAMRMSMRRAYLMSIQLSVGMANYNAEDDTFMDAIDIKVEMLAKRAGIQTPTEENNTSDINPNDPFRTITRLNFTSDQPNTTERLKALANELGTNKA